MKLFSKLFPLFIVLFLIAPQAGSASNFPFTVGETLRFQIRVFNIHVGFQDMTFKGETMLNGRRVLHAVADTRSLDSIKTMFNYSLHDVIEVWMDPVTLLPVRVFKDIQEGTWTDKVTIDIDQTRRNARYFDKRTPNGVNIPLRGPTLDLLSLVYYVRAQNVKPGDVLKVDYIVDNKKGVSATEIVVKRGAPLTISGQRVPTLIFEQQGGERVTVRMTDDDRRIPISISVGTFEVFGYTIDIVGNLTNVTRP
jgi:hypothetical protein